MLLVAIAVISVGVVLTVVPLDEGIPSLADSHHPEGMPPDGVSVPVPFPGTQLMPEVAPAPALSSDQVVRAKDIALSDELSRRLAAKDSRYEIEGVSAWHDKGELKGALVVMRFDGVDLEADWPIAARNETSGAASPTRMHAKVNGLRVLGLLVDLDTGVVAEAQVVTYDSLENGEVAPPSPPAGWVGD